MLSVIFISTRNEKNCLQKRTVANDAERIFWAYFRNTEMEKNEHFGKLQKYLKHLFLDYYSSIWHKSCKIFIDYLLAIGLPFPLTDFTGVDVITWLQE